jgi:spore germination cell wall hydrolase CwlJ-like protein
MNKVSVITAATGTAVVAVLWFQQQEIQTVHEDVQEIKQFLIHTNQKVSYDEKDRQCLAKNIYHEAGVEPREGKFAVAQVTLNRLRAGIWGKSICSVVYSYAQFSWTLFAKTKYQQPQGPLWEDSVRVANEVLEKGARVPSLESATYYHADYVKPYWVNTVTRVEKIGRHIFYSKV